MIEYHHLFYRLGYVCAKAGLSLEHACAVYRRMRSASLEELLREVELREREAGVWAPLIGAFIRGGRP